MLKSRGYCLLKRYLFLCVGLFIMSLGIAFSIKSNLGTSPISSLPYVVDLFTPLTVGEASIIMHCVFILLQILLLRKRYQLIQLMQLPVAIFFGYMTDLSVWIIDGIGYSAYWQQWILCLIGILLVAVGVSIEVTANVVTLAGEGLVLAFCQVFNIKFGYMKVIFDISLVTLSCILSFAFLGHLQGVREGTVVAAVGVGLVARQINKRLKKFQQRFLTEQPSHHTGNTDVKVSK